MSGKFIKHNLFLLLVAALLAACQPASTSLPATETAAGPLPSIPSAVVEMGTPEEFPTKQAAESPIDADPLASCPKEEAGKSLYVSEILGFCFLYPDGFTLEQDELRPDDGVKLVGPTELEKEKSQERASVVMLVRNNGAADVADSAAYAQKWRELNQPMMGPVELEEKSSTIGGQPAVVTSGLPGMILQQLGFVVANGYKYSLMVSPMPGFAPELDGAVNEGWDTVASSIVFFPPILPRETTRSQDVCPQPTEGTRLMLNEVEGYCFLYPADFEPVPEFVGRIQGGPNLGNWQGFENVRAALTVGSYPQVTGQRTDNPRDIIAARSDIDPAGVEDRTIGGARAILFLHDPQGGPWASKQVVAVTNDRVYTIIGDPWEPEQWPEAMPFVENAWDTAINSIVFFTPWN